MANWTEDDLRAHKARRAKGVMHAEPVSSASANGWVTHPPKSTSKYRNQKCQWNGETFDSKRELEAYIGLCALEKAGKIVDLKRQVPYALHCPMAGCDGASAEVATYIADYTYRDEQGRLHVVDAKGVRTRMFQLKAKWMTLEYGITVELL